MKVTAKVAEAVRTEIMEAYPHYVTDDCQPVIQRGDHWDRDPKGYMICWEEGPYEWSMDFSTKKKGIFTEAYNHFVVSICEI